MLMKRILSALLTLTSVGSNQHPDARWFPDAGLGLFIHWGLASVGATGDLSWGMLANKPWKDQTVTPNTYYTKIDLIWFDGGKGGFPDTGVRRLQPGIIVNRRNGGGGDYRDSEGKLPDKRFKGWFRKPACCAPARRFPSAISMEISGSPCQPPAAPRAWRS